MTTRNCELKYLIYLKALKSEDRERYVICEYNATHHMFAEVYEDHLKTCTDFRYYEADKFEMPLGMLISLPQSAKLPCFLI